MKIKVLFVLLLTLGLCACAGRSSNTGTHKHDSELLVEEDTIPVNPYAGEEIIPEGKNSLGYEYKNLIQPNAERLKLTEREGMEGGYDSLRLAILYASEVVDFTSFPKLPYSIKGYDDFAIIDRYYSSHIKWGPGMNIFREIVSNIFRRRKSDFRPLDQILRRFAPMIKLLIPYEKYTANGWDKVVEQLLLSYSDLSDNSQNFVDIYQVMDDKYTDYPDYHYEVLKDYFSEIDLQMFISEKEIDKPPIKVKAGELNKWSLMWCYSFWARRYYENQANVENIASALRVVRDELYNPDMPDLVVDRELPPMEPYLSSNIRPGELIYPWKIYTDQIIYEDFHDEGDYPFLIGKRNGENCWLIDFFQADERDYQPGNLLEIEWCEAIYYSAGDSESPHFGEILQNSRVIKY